MALPAGIVTKTLTVSSGVGIAGGQSSLEVLIQPEYPGTQAIVWASTSEPLTSFFRLERLPPGTAAIIQIPVIDQPGFINDRQEPATDWYYKITVRYLADGRKVGVRTIKYIKPFTTDPDIIDFDTIPSGTEPINRGPLGLPGESAYQIAVRLGFSGTEEEWIEYLRQGPQGPPGEIEVYTHVQSQPEIEWVISHNLGRYPAAITLSDSARRLFYAEWQYIDPNTVVVRMTGAQSGYAYVL